MKVIYVVSLPVMRDGLPVGAQLEVEDDYLPNELNIITPTEDVELYVMCIKYDPSKKTATVELSFLSEEEQDNSEELSTETLALYEMDFERLLIAGWMPITKGDMSKSDEDDPSAQKQRVH